VPVKSSHNSVLPLRGVVQIRYDLGACAVMVPGLLPT
jgi:hypothetical protein